MIGRRSQFAELVGLLDEARAGRGTAALAVGEAGMGKSTLAEAVATYAEGSGWLVVWGWCGSGETPPYWPWRTVLNVLDTDHPLNGAISGSVDRVQLFSAVATKLASAAGPRPLLVIVEDLHWADLPSLVLLDALVARIRAARVSLLLTARDEAAEASPEVAARLQALPTSVVRIELAGLAEGEVGELLRGVVTDAPDDLVAAVHARTGGNPFFVREVARLIHSQDRSRSVAVPGHVREVLERRLARLSQSAHRVLAVAAVGASSGEYLNVPLVTAIAGGTTAAVLGRVDEAVQARLVAVEPGGRLRFAHALVREVLESGLSVHDSAELHTAVAVWLENADRDEDLAGEIARHWAHSVRPDAAARSARWSLAAARTAAGRFGFEQAVGAYRRALAAPDADGLALRLELGEAQRLAGDPIGARRTVLDAAALARAAGRGEDLARAGLGLGGGLAGFEVSLRDATAVALLTEALDALPEGDSALRAAVLARLSLALAGLDTDQRRFDLARQAVAMADRSADVRVRVAAYAAYCDATAGPDHVGDRRAAATRMRALAELSGDPAGMLLASRLRVVALLEQGDFPAADVEADWYSSTAERVDVPPLYRWAPAIWRGARALMAGGVAAAFAGADEAEQLAQRAGSANGEMMAHTLRIAAHRARGTIADYADTVHALLADDTSDATTITAMAAAVLYELGDVDRSASLLQRIVDAGVDAIVHDSEYLETGWQVGEAALHLADRRAAELAYSVLEPYPQLWAVDGIGGAVLGVVAHQLGRLAVLLDRYADAADWLDIAGNRHRAAGATLLSAATDAARAELTAATRVTAAPPAAVEARQSDQWGELRREGMLWRLSFRGATAAVPDSKGLHDLATLLARPGRDVHVLDLVDATGAARATASDVGPILDATARDAYRRRLIDLDDEVAAAEAGADLGRASKLRAEQEFLSAELASAMGLRGRVRAAGDPTERARKAVHMRIATALRVIAEVHPTLGRHLRQAVSTGRFCVYRPEQPVRWRT
jgi:hypothetical protein